MLLLLLLAILPEATPKLICVLSDCSIDGAEPAHPNCTLDHFLTENLTPVIQREAAQIGTNSRGSFLNIIGSNSGPFCVAMEVLLVIQNDDKIDPSKLQLSARCRQKGMFNYDLTLELVGHVSSGRLKCFRRFDNETDQCKRVRNDRLRLTTLDGGGMRVENLNRNGKFLGGLDFEKEKVGPVRNEPCDCKKYDRLSEKYLFCEEDAAVGLDDSIGKYVAYVIAAFYVAIVGISVLAYFLFLKSVIEVS
uniref:(northern house mosquito) hypothetical protein n=1 Tax=Culex pipiens TaxID=7175 RepID=A0A8D8FXW3_CULPI